MSSALDVNVLVGADNADDVAHGSLRRLVDDALAGDELVYAFWPVLLGYLRIVTSPRILSTPVPVADALANVDALVAAPHIRSPGEGERFWPAFCTTAADVRPRGGDAPDVHLVALMREHGVRRLYTRDRGFLRFGDIDVVDPAA